MPTTREQSATDQATKRGLAGIHKADAFGLRQIAHARRIHRLERLYPPSSVIAHYSPAFQAIAPHRFGESR